MTQNEGDENQQRVELVPLHISSFGPASAIFLFFFFYFEVSESDTYIVSFQGKSTFEDDDLAATVSNNNEITIYRLSDISNISSTRLLGESGEAIESGHVAFANPLTTENGYSRIVQIVNGSSIQGLFSGWMVVNTTTGDVHYIPLTVSSQPYIIAPLLLVLTGVCLAVIVWEIIIYYRYSEDINQRVRNVANIERKWSPENIKKNLKRTQDRFSLSETDMTLANEATIQKIQNDEIENQNKIKELKAKYQARSSRTSSFSRG